MFLCHLYTSLSLFLVCRSSVCLSIRLSVHWFVTELFLRLFVASLKVFSNVLVCSSVCLPDFSESADARDLGLMTLFQIYETFIFWCCRFFGDLLKKLEKINSFTPDAGVPITMDFIRLKSYENDESTGDVKVVGGDKLLRLKGKHVLVVEDIVDTGKVIKR